MASKWRRHIRRGSVLSKMQPGNFLTMEGFAGFDKSVSEMKHSGRDPTLAAVTVKVRKRGWAWEA